MDSNQNIQLSYSQQRVMQEMLSQTDKIKEFKTRIEAFKDISTLEEAKTLAKKVLPVLNEVSHFRIGGARCVVVNKPDIFRISLDTGEEFISYDFS